MNYKFKTKPYAHQLTALEKSWNKENYAYFMEMGTGKTKVLIDNVAMLYDKGKIDGVLIIAPKGVVKTWYEQELPTHLPDHIENVSVLWQPNITKTQQEKLDSLFEIDSALHILVMNVEALSTEKGVKFATKFINSHKTLMAIDESTTIKTPTARRTKNIIKIGLNAKYKRIMTGSPITKNPLDLYTQCEFLDPWLLDFSSYYAFRNRYAEMKTIPKEGCKPLIEEMGIGEAVNKKVGKFSKGMQQRLGMARALLGTPPILILDEPSGGLDPRGVALIRNKIREMKDKGSTVFVSSHILAEVQEVCNRVGIIDKGVLVAEDSVSKLSVKLNLKHKLIIELEKISEKIVESVKKVKGVEKVEAIGVMIHITCNQKAKSKIIISVEKAGGDIVNIQTKEPSLEEVFMGFTES